MGVAEKVGKADTWARDPAGKIKVSRYLRVEAIGSDDHKYVAVRIEHAKDADQLAAAKAGRDGCTECLQFAGTPEECLDFAELLKRAAESEMAMRDGRRH